MTHAGVWRQCCLGRKTTAGFAGGGRRQRQEAAASTDHLHYKPFKGASRVIAKPIHDIVESDLLALVETRAAESRHLEFKRQLPDGTDQGKVKFLRSVTAFANTAGGDLIYGIDAVEGEANSITSLDVQSRDQVLQRLESLCAAGADPRLSGVQFRWVSLTGGGASLVVRVPQSWNAPHRVTASNHNHFYGRNSAGVYPMDVVELRRAFTLSGEVAQRIRTFRADRILSLSSGHGPMLLQPGAIGVLHVIPLQAFTSEIRLEFAKPSTAMQQIYPIGSRGHNDRLNLDGRLAFRSDSEGRSFGYAQLFRNGIIEAATVHPERNTQKVLPSLTYEEDILRALNAYLPALQALGLETPAYVFFSLLGIKGYRMGVDRSRHFDADTFVADRELLNFPEVLVSDWTSDTSILMRPVFDTVWNAFGLMRSFNYDGKGEWIGR